MPFKYQDTLAGINDCPPSTYTPYDAQAYRWITREMGDHNFIPVFRQRNPSPRQLDETDQLCKGNGLSFFNSFEGALAKYKQLNKNLRTNLLISLQASNQMGEFALMPQDGVAGDLTELHGHFTFHESEGADLTGRITNIYPIFEEDGTYRDHSGAQFH